MLLPRVSLLVCLDLFQHLQVLGPGLLAGEAGPYYCELHLSP